MTCQGQEIELFAGSTAVVEGLLKSRGESAVTSTREVEEGMKEVGLVDCVGGLDVSMGLRGRLANAQRSEMKVREEREERLIAPNPTTRCLASNACGFETH
jgi:hypothetical protein